MRHCPTRSNSCSSRSWHSFTPLRLQYKQLLKQIKIKKTLIGSLLLACTLIACSDDDNVTPKVKGNFKSILCNDQPITKDIQVDSKTKLNFAVTTENTETANIIWTLNGDTLANGLDKALELEGRSGKLKISLVEGQTTLDETEVNLDGPFKSGAYLYAKDGGLTFINNLEEQTTDATRNIYAGINDTKKTILMDFVVNNGKVYLVEETQIIVADAQTLHKLDVIEDIQANELVVVNNKLAYAKDNNKLFALNLVEKTKTAVEGVSNFRDTKMAALQDYIAIAKDNAILLVETKTNKLDKVIPIDDNRAVFNILSGNDGNLYAFIHDKSADIKEDHFATFMKINTENLSIEKETPIDIELIDTPEEHKNFYATASPVKDEFFFAEGSGRRGSFNVYKIDYKGTVDLFKNIPMRIQYQVDILQGYMGVNSENKLFIPLLDGYGNNINCLIYDLEQELKLDYKFTRFSYTSQANVVPVI